MDAERVPDYAPRRVRRYGDDCPTCGARLVTRWRWEGDGEYYCRADHPAGAEAFDIAVAEAYGERFLVPWRPAGKAPSLPVTECGMVSRAEFDRLVRLWRQVHHVPPDEMPTSDELAVLRKGGRRWWKPWTWLMDAEE